jgi:hypothetical protein
LAYEQNGQIGKLLPEASIGIETTLFRRNFIRQSSFSLNGGSMGRFQSSLRRAIKIFWALDLNVDISMFKLLYRIFIGASTFSRID